jgi:hypothetical protein
MADDPIAHEQLACALEQLNDALSDVRYWSLRVMGWRRAMPDSYDPEQSVIAQAAQRRSLICLLLMLGALPELVAAANEHEEFPLKLVYDRPSGWYELVTLPG